MRTAAAVHPFAKTVSKLGGFVRRVAIRTAGACVSRVTTLGASGLGVDGSIIMPELTSRIDDGICRVTVVTGCGLGAVRCAGGIAIGNVAGEAMPIGRDTLLDDQNRIADRAMRSFRQSG